MISWNELKERRIVQMTVAYLAVGWVVVSVIDQFVDRGLFPDVAYVLVIVAYLGGIPAALIIGWFHGEKGSQSITKTEVGLLGAVAVATGVFGFGVWSNYRDEQSLAASLGLDAAFDPRRVAVLYFEDLGSASDSIGPIADGLTEALISELSRVQALDVISSNGVTPYRGTPLTPDSIGRALSAGTVIQGSVEPTGGQVRTTVRLVDAVSGVDIARTSFSMPVAELLQARDSLVSLTSEFLRERLGEEVSVRGRRAGTSSVPAWTTVQRAERVRKDAEVALGSDPAQALALLAQADSLLTVAQALDGAWTEPVALRAGLALQRSAWSRGDAAIAAMRAGMALADSALLLDQNFAPTWYARGSLQYRLYLLNASPTQLERAALLDGAQSDLERAVNLDPTLAPAFNILSRLHYDRRDRLSAALAARQALQADSYLRDADSTFDRLFWAHYDLGQFAEATRTCREAGARFPADSRFQQCALWVMITPTADADPDAAWALAARADSLSSPGRRAFTTSVSNIVVAGVLARANLPDSARHVLEASRVGVDVDPGQQLPAYEAIVWTLLGDHAAAIQQLRRYIVANPDHAFFEVDGDLHWWWRPLRNEPGFDAVVGRR